MTNNDSVWWAEEANLNNIGNDTNVINVSWPERLASVGVGAFMISSGFNSFTKKPLASLVRAALGGYLIYRGASGSCRVYSALGKTRDVHHPESINVRTSLIVDRPRQEVYDFWRRLENLPLFINHLNIVTQINNTHSRWEAELPGGMKLNWTAEIVKDEPGHLLGWQSLPESVLQNAGKIEFRDTPAGGTELRIIITYRAPAGDIGVGIAKLLNPFFARMIEKDIADFILYMEEKEVAII